MISPEQPGKAVSAGLLAKERTLAAPGFNRWLVPPAALAIHLSIGMAYGFSVFWLPLSRAIGIERPVTCDGIGFFTRLTSSSCDWPVSILGWTYTLFFVFLGASAALFGHWLEKAGPRKAGFVAALCWSGGLLISALGVYLHQIWLMWLGSGVIGGIGLGLGYISPVSTLHQVVSRSSRHGDRTGHHGFWRWRHDRRPARRPADEFFRDGKLGRCLANIRCPGRRVFRRDVARRIRLSTTAARVAAGAWRGGGAAAEAPVGHLATRACRRSRAHAQFWLLWAVLCLNVSAGIGVIGMASPMLQEVFGGQLLHIPLRLAQLSEAQRAQVAALAAAFAGLLSLFNIAGRIVWASFSDYIGRKLTYAAFLRARHGFVHFGAAGR